MFQLIFVLIYVMMGVCMCFKYKTKEKYLIDKLGDYAFKIIFWFPVVLFVVFYNGAEEIKPNQRKHINKGNRVIRNNKHSVSKH